MIPIGNRIICKTTIPNYSLADLRLSKGDLEKRIKDLEERIKFELSINMSKEIVNKLGMEMVGAVGNEHSREYVLQAYVFTRDELFDFIDKIKNKQHDDSQRPY